jgi:AraC-like DNA-binding protein
MNVVALLSDHLLFTLRAVLGDDHRVVAPTVQGDVVRAVQSAAADVLVVEPASVAGAQWPALVDLLRRAGTPTVVVYTTITPPAMRATVELARVGIRHIILKGYDDTPRRFRAVFDTLATEFWSSVLSQRLAPRCRELPLAARDAVALLFRRPDHVRDVAALARLAGVAPRTLHRRLGQVGIASPKRLVLAARVEWAHALLRSGQLGVADVATRLGYASPRRFRRETQLLTGLPPAQLTRRLAPDELVERLHARVTERANVGRDGERSNVGRDT